MKYASVTRVLLPLLAVASTAPAVAQGDYGNPRMQPVNDLPNPYSAKQVMPLPDGRVMVFESVIELL